MKQQEYIISKAFEHVRGLVNSINRSKTFEDKLTVLEKPLTLSGPSLHVRRRMEIQRYLFSHRSSSFYRPSETPEIDHSHTMWSVRISLSDRARGTIEAFAIDAEKTKVIFSDGRWWYRSQERPLIGEPFDQLVKLIVEEFESDNSRVQQLKQENQQLKNEAVSRTLAIKRLKRKVTSSNISEEQLIEIVDRNRFKNGKPNFTAIGRELGCHKDTAKNRMREVGVE